MKEYTLYGREVALRGVEGPVNGPPVLLFHGLCDRWQALRPVLASLSTHWHLYATDLRGHGMSGRTPGRYLPDDYCRDASEFFTNRLTEPAVLFGHSAGALIALRCAAEHPNRVRAVISGDLFCSSQRLASLIERPESVAYCRQLQRLAAQPPDRIASSPLAKRFPTEARREWAVATSLLAPDVLQHHARGDGVAYMEGFDMDTVLARVRCPVLLLCGDPALGATMAEEDVTYARTRLDEGHVARLDGVGHDLGLFSGSARPLLRAIDEFLARVTAREPDDATPPVR